MVFKIWLLIIGVVLFCRILYKWSKAVDNSDKYTNNGKHSADNYSITFLAGPSCCEPHPSAQISQQFYDSCEYISYRLLIFLKELNEDKELIDFLHNNIEGIDSIDKYKEVFPNYDPRLAIMLLMDITNCVIQLGHEFNEPSRENLCLALLMVRMLDKDKRTDISYSNFITVWNKYVPIAISMLGEISKIRDRSMKPNMFYMIPVLAAVCKQKEENYKALLLRFSTLVANADDYKSDREKAFLTNIFEGNDEIITSRLTVLKSFHADSSPYESLQQLIGLGVVKEEVSRLVNFIKIQKARAEKGLKTPQISYHCVFSGNPGTGKTTVARILAGIYRELGVIKKGEIVETDRSGLVAEYVGQTAVKTNKIIDKSLDGILFIDEAYSLATGGVNDFGQEAIATLLKRMEDDRDRLVIILAGYDNDMNHFIESNPGLKSRFSRFIHFDDFKSDELSAIFIAMLDKNEYKLAEGADKKLYEIMNNEVINKDNNFGNARFVRNLFERTLENQAVRLASESDLQCEDLQTIIAEDIAL